MFWYEDDIKNLEKKRSTIDHEPQTLFYGSSSIRLWGTLANDLPQLDPVNLGFGGSTLAACTWFFDRVMAGYQPKRLIVYAGDNDLGDGRSPEEVFLFFREFAAAVEKRFGLLPCYFISLKLSPSRRNLSKQFIYTNDLISAEIKNNRVNWHWIDVFNPMLNADGSPNKELYQGDGLHLSAQGYNLWTKAVTDAVNQYN